MQLNKAEVVNDVQVALQVYLAALESNDINQLDALFWESESAVRFGADETLIGKSRIRAFRSKRDKRPPLHIDRLLVTTFGEDTATVCLLFRRLAAPGLIGRWSQHWACIDGAWKITSAHVSTAPVPSGHETHTEKGAG